MHGASKVVQEFRVCLNSCIAAVNSKNFVWRNVKHQKTMTEWTETHSSAVIVTT